MSIRDEAARGFQHGAEAYERGRPGYPPEAVKWLWRELRLGPGRTVLDVAAGTGKLTRELVPSGAAVVAVEPVAGMMAVLEQVVPGATALSGTAEALPLSDQSVDAITVAQAFHWFDGPAAVVEFHRVLRPGGRFGLIWNRRNVDEPIHRAVREIIEPYHRDSPSHYRGEWRRPVEDGGLFAAASHIEVPSEQVLGADSFVDRFNSISYIAALPEAERASVTERLRAVASQAGEPIRLGYTTEAYVYDRA
ncbi:MAG TPA: methyltransferase domain-containing protein [Solirubrobacteraceae bacterium]|nr:methyltransferase domain-containing protein [Solirubrobacteraceae bacterium]